MIYAITYAPSVAKNIKKLDRQVARRIFRSIEELSLDPRPPGCIQLKGGDGEYRVRVGNYRIVYDIEDDALVILILRVAHRKEVYR